MSRPDAAMLTASLMVRKGAAQPSRLFALPTPLAEPRPAPVAAAKAPAATTPGVAAAAVSTKDRRRLTLRLDPDRHLRLKLAAAHLDLSLQELLIAALDSHLAREAPCACLASDQKK
jgi:hypothetical protein